MRNLDAIVQKAVQQGTLEQQRAFIHETAVANWKEACLLDGKSKKKGKLVGRYLVFDTPGGSAYYRISVEHEKRVRLKHIGVTLNMHDDFGKRGTIEKEAARQNIIRREKRELTIKHSMFVEDGNED